MLDSTGCRIPREYPMDKAKRLERENRALKEQIEDLEWELKVAIEGQRCECGYDDMCRFARERDNLKELIRLIISWDTVASVLQTCDKEVWARVVKATKE